MIETFKLLTDREKISRYDLFDVRQRNICVDIHLNSKEVQFIHSFIHFKSGSKAHKQQTEAMT